MNKMQIKHFFLLLFVVFMSCSGVKKEKAEGSSEVKTQTSTDITQLSALLLSSTQNGDVVKVQEYLKGGADVNFKDQDNRTALMFASFNGAIQIVEELLKCNAEINLVDVNGRSALLFAASGPFPETVKLLLAKGAAIDIQDNEEHFSALMFAAAEGQLENVKILVENGANTGLKDIDGDNALSFAQANGHTAVVDYLTKIDGK
ncbi:ankyrin repeat domain-containing protein [uncultured Draconibacterium sp.]|uniref:ankyrin repeat domain-containing protein n=1 Tax=uncultured Draconibacterium sp. TaxID=1573823 RepID=UPI0032165FEF